MAEEQYMYLALFATDASNIHNGNSEKMFLVKRGII